MRGNRHPLPVIAQLAALIALLAACADLPTSATAPSTQTPAPLPAATAIPTRVATIGAAAIASPPPTAVIPSTLAPGVTAILAPTPEQEIATLSHDQCTLEWFMPDPPQTCAGEPWIGAGAAQRFEGGLMVWLAQDDQVVVFYNDVDRLRQYVKTTDPWQEGLPESDPGLVPPAGLVQPVRGFGMIWRGEANTGRAVPRDLLGWATAPEVPYVVTFQCELQAAYPDCYLLGPDGEVIELYTFAPIWNLWTGPSG